MGVQCTVFVNLPVYLPEDYLQRVCHYWSSLPRILNDVIFKELFCRAAPQKSNSSPENSTSNTESNDQTANRLTKSAVGVFYVYLVFLLCYLPEFCCFAVVVISDLIKYRCKRFFFTISQ